MREMVLNHASLASCAPAETAPWLVDLAAGMSALIGSGVAKSSLRMRAPDPGGFSIHDSYQELRRRGERDPYVFLSRLSTKSPLLDGVAEGIADRFRGCEALGCETKKLRPEDGEPLVLCAISDAIAVGGPSEPVWDRDQLTVRFQELLRDESFEESWEQIDNLTRASHATPILERHRTWMRRSCVNGADLWARRKQLFPHLVFGPDVEGDLGRLNVLEKVIRRLADLDASAAPWSSGPVPDWICGVRPEGQRVMTTPKLREARRFASGTGSREVFEYHASFGKGGRIHLRVDPARRQVEIGYIGGHLPTARF